MAEWLALGSGELGALSSSPADSWPFFCNRRVAEAHPHVAINPPSTASASRDTRGQHGPKKKASL